MTSFMLQTTRLDIHLHTRRHSGDSLLDERQLVTQALRAGLNGVVITEHHFQWPDDELAELRRDIVAPPGFVLLSGFEYSSRKGDILVYGLDHTWAQRYAPGREPDEMLRIFQEAGAVCIAAHPTRERIPFDDRILDMPFQGLEVESCNMAGHEQRLARKLAAGMNLPMTASSDAHRIEDLGAYATSFEGRIESMSDFVDCVRRGAFAPAARATT
jgi:predicted metal-dependent phosphoesterase TrpH